MQTHTINIETLRKCAFCVRAYFFLVFSIIAPFCLVADRAHSPNCMVGHCRLYCFGTVSHICVFFPCIISPGIKGEAREIYPHTRQHVELCGIGCRDVLRVLDSVAIYVALPPPLPTPPLTSPPSSPPLIAHFGNPDPRCF